MQDEIVHDAMKIFFYEVYEEERVCLARMLPQGWQADFIASTPQEAGHAVPPAPHISIRTQSLIPADWLHDVSLIVSRSTGYDHLVALKRLTPKPGAALSCLPKYCGQAVAEHALMLWMALARKLRAQLSSIQSFNRDGLTGSELKGRRLVVAGVGDIGYRVVAIGQALGMQVYGVDPEPRHEALRYVSLAEGLAMADILVCAMNLTENNRGLFSIEQWRRAKPGLLFVNVSRGECSPFQDLLLALNEGWLGGVGLDVFNHEAEFARLLRTGVPADSQELSAARELLQHPQVLFTPHNAFNTQEATERKCALTIDQFKAFESCGQFLHQPPALSW